ncbi:uncharacterized protein LOC111394972 [Olea europaea var. sylvestris]|uniref:uncharacterized protein LOC111394972 n=1 Tax=Olea europaea var. sylvestris TaxID=158386 RepID=UPI000C1D3120|nr:uncharacterized protein LOC111394972 [Olea europaea var. sylvestris]
MRPSQHLDRDYSFGANGVFGTEGDNHEKIKREINEGDTMREIGTGDAVRKFDGGRTVMETVARGIEIEVETGEIKREVIVKNIESEAVAGSIERETKTGGAVIDTIAKNIEREMDVVDIENGSNERIRMYTKVFTHKRKILDKTYHQIDALIRDKRLKKASKLVSSPYMTGAKWSRFCF